MIFDLHILRKKGRNIKSPILYKRACIALNDNFVYAFDSKGEKQIADFLYVVKIEIVKDGIFIRGLEESADKKTAWYQEWWLRPPETK